MDSGTLTNISIVYLDIQQEETGFISLQPLVFTVYFSGMLPEGLLQENIPIQISVSIDKEYGIFTTPVVNAVSMDMRDSDTWQEDSLPLSDSSSKEIETWLVLEVNPESLLWTWRRDTFWLAFVGAYPVLPERQMADVGFSGASCRVQFIEAWLDQSGAEGEWIGVQGTNEVLDHI
ncbi:hypothetical protein EDB19DRAFT_1831719 [Suillus lakei]|nr:hypothetical protein EDB19DRAFT_1831719 [Suillus lakei]